MRSATREAVERLVKRMQATGLNDVVVMEQAEFDRKLAEIRGRAYTARRQAEVSREEVSQRFNEQLEAYKRGELKGRLNFGKPMGWLARLDLPSRGEITMSLTDLTKHLDKHNLSVDDIRNLPGALSEPLIAYEWGTKSPSLVVVTSLLKGDERITVAIRLSRQGARLEVNEIASVHGKASERFLQDMMQAKEGGLSEAIRLVPNKTKALEWLGLVPPRGDSLTS